MYVKSEENVIYKVKVDSINDKDLLITLILTPIASVDYIDIDNNDMQGYTDINNNTIEAELVTVLNDESIKERLLEENYIMLNKLPKIHNHKWEE